MKKIYTTNKLFLVLFIVLFGGQNVEAQKLKNLWSKAKKEVKKEVDEYLNKEGKEITKTNPKGSNGKQLDSKPKGMYSIDDVDLSQLRIMQAPNKNFDDILLEEYKGLPRFGISGYYGLQPTGNEGNYSKTLESFRQSLKGHNYTKYSSLVDLKYLKPVYDSIDRTNLTKVERGYTGNLEKSEIIKSRYSYRAQNHLRHLILNFGTKEIKEEYFCNQENTRVRCKFDSTMPSPSDSRASSWGGYNATVFDQQKKYADFVDKYLDVLQKWASSIWKENELDAYIVLSVKQWSQSDYDFKNQGFWINYEGDKLGEKSVFNKDDTSILGEYIPKNRFEKEIMSKTILFPMDAKKADDFLSKNNLKTLSGYVVFKVKIKPKGFNKDYGHVHTSQINYSYNLDSPIIELYLDSILENKIGEIDLTNVVQKTN